MTITISRRKVLVSVLAIAMIAAACYIAFLAGQTTRITDADASERAATAVERAVSDARKQETAKRLTQVKAVRTAARKHETRRVKKLNREWRRRLERETEAAREEGMNSGYASGQSVGYSSGREEGVEEGIEEGIEEASDELDCSDDLDVPLPACSW